MVLRLPHSPTTVQYTHSVLHYGSCALQAARAQQSIAERLIAHREVAGRLVAGRRPGNSRHPPSGRPSGTADPGRHSPSSARPVLSSLFACRAPHGIRSASCRRQTASPNILPRAQRAHRRPRLRLPHRHQSSWRWHQAGFVACTVQQTNAVLRAVRGQAEVGSCFTRAHPSTTPETRVRLMPTRSSHAMKSRAARS